MDECISGCMSVLPGAFSGCLANRLGEGGLEIGVPGSLLHVGNHLVEGCMIRGVLVG